MDRNAIIYADFCFCAASLSARRAWIEIKLRRYRRSGCTVALRKESVDRNTIGSACTDEIEVVALRKESVDRNRKRTMIL